MGEISLSVKNLEQTPDDGPLQLRLDQYVTEPGGSESEDVSPCPTAPRDIGSMSSSFALNVQGHFSETANVARMAGLSPQSVEATNWAGRGRQRINESHREGYITQVFPTLFPSGAAEYLVPRPTGNKVKIYIKPWGEPAQNSKQKADALNHWTTAPVQRKPVIDRK